MTQLSLEQAIELAMQKQSQGDLQQAEQIYRQILSVAPNHAYTLEQFGLLALQVGRADVAVDLLQRAAAGNPQSADCQYNLGLALATAGQVQSAIQAYQQALRINPNLVEAYNNLAVIMINTGKPDSAIELCRKAVALRPELPEAHENLATALRAKGSFDEAVNTSRQATVLRPQFPDSWNGLGLSLQLAGRTDEAVEAFQRAVALNPNHADALENLGAALHRRGNSREGLTMMRRALATRPNMAQSLSNTAALLIELGEADEAIELLRRAMAAQPDFFDAHNNLGLALRQKRRYEEAAQAHRAAIALKPNSAETWRNLGQALQLHDRTREAIEAYRHALSLRPQYAEAMSSLGTALMELREVKEATDLFRQAIAANPDYPLARFNLSQSLLLTGDWLEAWELQEWRWKAPDLKLPRPGFTQPQWDGSDLAGKRILVFAEQGFGDAIHFGRYLPLVAQRGGTVIFQCQSGLIRLFEKMQGVGQCVAFDAPLPPFDVQIPLMTLPMIFKTTLDTVPSPDGYLRADPGLSRAWKDRVDRQRAGKMAVGLVWGGRPDQKNDRNRSMPLSALAPLAEVDGVEFFSLQKGEPAAQLKNPPPGLKIVDWTSDLDDFSDTAALLDNLDLLISVDTGPSHLAGAMGKPVWVLAAFFADWRYMLGRSDNPWYSSMRLFRQPRAGDWETPVRQALEALRDRLKKRA